LSIYLLIEPGGARDHYVFTRPAVVPSLVFLVEGENYMAGRNEVDVFVSSFSPSIIPDFFFPSSVLNRPNTSWTSVLYGLPKQAIHQSAGIIPRLNGGILRSRLELVYSTRQGP
jgi:hypothetical protein